MYQTKLNQSLTIGPVCYTYYTNPKLKNKEY